LPPKLVLSSFGKHVETVVDLLVGTRRGNKLFKLGIIVSENQLLRGCFVSTSSFLLDLLISLWRIVRAGGRSVLLCDLPGLGSFSWLVNFCLEDTGRVSLNIDLLVICWGCLHGVPFGLIGEIDI